MSHRVSKLFLPDDLPSRVVVLSPKGDLSVLDVELTVKNTLQSQNDNQVLLQSFTISCQSCQFIQARALPPHGSVILLIFAVNDELHAQRCATIGEDDTLIKLGDCTTT